MLKNSTEHAEPLFIALIVENIVQLHENPFFSCSFSEMDFMTSSVWFHLEKLPLLYSDNSHKCSVKISIEIIDSVKNGISFNF